MTANAQIIVSLKNLADPEVRKLVGSFRTLAGETRGATTNFERLERQFVALQNSEIRVATATGQLDRALHLIQTEMAAAGQGTVRYNQLLVQQEQIQQRLAREAARAAAGQRQSMDALRNALQPVAATANRTQQGVSGLAGALGSLQGIAAGFGIGVGLQQLISGGIGAAGQALQLRETKNALKAVAGDTQTYAAILGEARRQQLLFGGSLQENIDGLSGLAVTSRSTGARLETLIDLQKRLAVLNPAQGAAGGLVALNEALAGNVTSLSKRFNIPREELKKLSDESLPVAERLKAIDSFLNKVGITSAAVAGKVDQDAVAFRRLAQEAGDLKTNVGNGLATAFSSAATGLSRLIGLINSNPQAIAELKAIQGGKGSVTAEDVTKVTRDVATKRVDDNLQTTFESTAERLVHTKGLFGGGSEFDATKARVLGLRDALIQLSASSEQNATAVQNTLTQLAQGTITTDQFAAIIGSLVERERAGVDVENFRAAALANGQRSTQNASTAAEQLNAELNAQATKAQLSAAQNQQLADRQQQLAHDSQLAAQGLLGAGNQALILARKYSVARDEAELLIDAQRRAEGQAHTKVVNENRDDLRNSRLNGQAPKPLSADFLADQQQRQKQLHDAELQLALTRAKTSAQRIALLQKELAGTSDLVERTKLLTQVAQEKNSADRKSVVASNKGLSANDRADLALVDDLDAKHAALLAKLQQGNLTELQRKQILNEIQTVEEKITAEKNKQVQSALDARIAAIEDRKQRRQEDRELNQAQRVLASNASQAFKDAARDQLELIPLQQQRRQLALQQQLREAGPLAGALPTAAGLPALPSLPGRGAPAAAPVAPAAPATLVSRSLTVQFSVDGKVIAERIVPYVLDDLHGGLIQADAAGAGRP